MNTAAMKRLALSSLIGLAACGGAGSGGNDWYYHWSCNGDSQCLSLNPGYAGQRSGTVGPEAGGQAGCNSLMIFGAKNWNIPPATQSCDTSPNAPPATLLSLTIAPANSTVAVGLTQQYTATGHYSDGTSKDLTAQVAWGMSATGIGATPVATITAGGMVRAGAVGSITVIADYGSLRATTNLNVGAATVQTITVTPANPSIAKGNTQQFTATAHYSDGTSTNITSQASWTSATSSVATIAGGALSTGVAAGTSVISASYGTVSGSTTLTVTGAALVSISVTPGAPIIARTFGIQFRAIGTYTDGTAQDVSGQVTWTSATTPVATVDPGGLAAGVAAGTSAIKATSGTIFGTTTLTVTAATLVSITLAPTTPTIAPGTTVPFTATGAFSDGTTQLLRAGVTWSSGTTSVATVDSTGLASGVAVGTSTVTAGLGAVSGSSLLTIATAPPGVSWAYLTTSPPVACTACSAGQIALTSIVWSGTQFVAVALSGAVVTSPDGLTWTTRVAGTSYGVTSYGPLFSVTWAPELSRFVAVGGGNIMTSPDGITWTVNTSGAISTAFLRGMVWTGKQFVAVGNVASSATQVIMTSPDGLGWSSSTSPSSGALRGVAWSGTVLVAVGDVTLVSTDGYNWALEADATTRWNGIAWSGNQFVEVGDVAGSSGKIRTSADGFTWTDRTVTSPPLYGVAWTGMQFVAMGGTGGQPAYGLGGMFGNPGWLSTSTDGVTWTPRSISAAGTTYNTTYTIYDVAWSGTRLVAVGAQYYAYTSP